MSNYRRRRVPGASYFFSVSLADKNSGLLIRRIDDLRAAYATTIREAPVFCDAMVILPNHLHAVWTLPPGDSNFPERWRKIKYRFSRAVGKNAHPTYLCASKRAKRECGIWQRRYWEHMIRDDADYWRHVNYCWGDPVNHGLANRAADWPYSSIHRDICAGFVTPDYTRREINGNFGE